MASARVSSARLRRRPYLGPPRAPGGPPSDWPSCGTRSPEATGTGAALTSLPALVAGRRGGDPKRIVHPWAHLVAGETRVTRRPRAGGGVAVPGAEFSWVGSDVRGWYGRSSWSRVGCACACTSGCDGPTLKEEPEPVPRARGSARGAASLALGSGGSRVLARRLSLPPPGERGEHRRGWSLRRSRSSRARVVVTWVAERVNLGTRCWTRVSVGPTQTVSLRRLIPPLERKVGMNGGSFGRAPGELGAQVIASCRRCAPVIPGPRELCVNACAPGADARPRLIPRV